jgi:DNA invertase Pin-like site-specific DNA recombinase
MKQKQPYDAYYMRTSHFLQNIITQVEQIPEGAVVFKDEGVSGRIEFQQRKAGGKLIEEIKAGRIKSLSTLSSDRLGRSTSDILASINIAHEHQVPIKLIREGITTLDEKGNVTPMTMLMTNLLSTLAEFAYLTQREKILSGVAAAKALGTKYTGRKPGSVEDLSKFLSKPKVAKIKTLLKEGVGVRKICRVTESSPNYVYKVKTRMLETA